MNNSEILYLYDAKLTNPNGDPDEENRPRMDDERNLVTDLRLKRYIRDYLLDLGEKLYVQKVDGQSVTGEQRVSELKLDKLETDAQRAEKILEEYIDVRLFGATMPIKGHNMQFTGPVQFNWGYSLNQVELLEAGITSHFSSAEKNRQGAMGRDYRVKYSLLAFSGVISGRRAEKTRLREEDVQRMDQALRYAIPLQATRSKIGQYPRLYLRIEYHDQETILGDLRSYIRLERTSGLNDIFQVGVMIDSLLDFLKENQDRVKRIHYFADPRLALVFDNKEISLEEALEGFPLREVR